MSSSRSLDFVDYYKLLGLQPTAEIEEIRRAFILHAKQHHPDAGGSTAVMQQLNQAYRTLTSSTAKAAYDMQHNFHVGSTVPGAYKYKDGREVNGVADMTDEEIDSFLNDVFSEYRNGPPKNSGGVLQWFKKLFI